MPGELSHILQVEYPCWRLIVENVATLEELETHWSLDDVSKANAILDMRADIKEANTPDARP